MYVLIVQNRTIRTNDSLKRTLIFPLLQLYLHYQNNIKRENMIRTIVVLLMTCLFGHLPLRAQLTLNVCREKAKENYPLIRQYRLLDLAEKYDLENADKGNLPQVVLSGKASYQSSVTTIPISVPGVSIKGLPKDQYALVAEVKQNVWDGGKIRAQKEQAQAEAEEHRRQVDVNLYQLNERVDQLYFGILLQDEQLKQNTLLLEELKRNYRQVSSYIKNGIANAADLDAVQMEILSAGQQRINIAANKKAYLKMLALLIGQELPDDMTLKKPEIPVASLENQRPELKWFDAQLHNLNVRENGLKTTYKPNFSLFAQGGVGNPGLNLLKNGWEPYYIIGARLTWNFSSLYTLKNDRLKLDAQRQLVLSNRDVFLLNTQVQVLEQDEAANALRQQMKEDDEIIRLRTNVRKAAEAKVAGGTLSVTEMLRELTNESLARQNKVAHEIQLLMRMYKRQYLMN